MLSTSQRCSVQRRTFGSPWDSASGAAARAASMCVCWFMKGSLMAGLAGGQEGVGIEQLGGRLLGQDLELDIGLGEHREGFGVEFSVVGKHRHQLVIGVSRDVGVLADHVL